MPSLSHVMLPADLRAASPSAMTTTSRTGADRFDGPPATAGPTAVNAIGPVCLVAAAAVTAMWAGVLGWTSTRIDDDQLTAMGTVNVRAEHDIPIYLLCGLAALMIVAGLAWLAGRRGPTREGRRGGRRQRLYAAVGAVGAVATSTALFLHAGGRLPAGPLTGPH